MGQPSKKRPEDADEFASANEESEPAFLVELFEFLRDNKRWWLWPIFVSLLLLSVLVLLNGTGAAPFIYSFF